MKGTAYIDIEGGFTIYTGYMVKYDDKTDFRMYNKSGKVGKNFIKISIF